MIKPDGLASILNIENLYSTKKVHYSVKTEMLVRMYTSLRFVNGHFRIPRGPLLNQDGFYFMFINLSCISKIVVDDLYFVYQIRFGEVL